MNRKFQEKLLRYVLCLNKNIFNYLDLLHYSLKHVHYLSF